MDRLELAKVWNEILRKRSQEFVPDEQLFTYNHIDEGIPQPGYVGKDYKERGLVFIGMNPGIEDPNKVQKGYKALKDLRDASAEEEMLNMFENLTNLLYETIPSWPTYKMYVKDILNHKHMNFSEVAYINLLPWPVNEKGSGKMLGLYNRSWELTEKQIALLNPALVVALGGKLGGKLAQLCRKHHLNGFAIKSIRRTRGDKSPSDKTIQDIDEICKMDFSML